MIEDLTLRNEYIKLIQIINSPLDVPGFGGNISVKDSDNIIVKASGEDLKKTHLAHLKNLNNDLCETIIITDNTSLITTAYSKPTMELKIHTSIKSKYVAHYHPVYILPFLCSDYIFDYLTIDYYTPGEELFNEINKHPHNKIIMLRNHGVILHSNSLQEIQDNYNKLYNEFFVTNTNYYTPDDYVDENNQELWLFRNAMENIANKLNLNLSVISKENEKSLDRNDSEKFRKEKMTK